MTGAIFQGVLGGENKHRLMSYLDGCVMMAARHLAIYDDDAPYGLCSIACAEAFLLRR